MLDAGGTVAMTNWLTLRRHTQARIGLGRAGAAPATAEVLALSLAHSQARDAVWRSWDPTHCAQELQAANIPHLVCESQAHDRTTYLTRPDLGRALAPNSIAQLMAARTAPAAEVALILSDGLSATAVQEHGLRTALAILTGLERAGTSHAPLVLIKQARVAISDQIGVALGVRAAIIVLGERPGLSAADSLGIYLTYDPKPGNTDAKRNCISNVREPGGLPPLAAAERLVGLLQRALALGVSGVSLKDSAPQLP
jgi:ethanolamine ammonia-lyase small subunit